MENILKKSFGKTLTGKGLIGLILAAIVFVVSLCLPANETLSIAGIRTIGLLATFLIILIANSLPILVTSFLFIGLMPLTGVTSGLGGALKGFSEPVVFFTLASFGLAAAFTTTPIAKRILRALLKVFGKNIGMVLLAIMSCTALVSSVISNVPTCAVFSAIALNFLDLYDKEEDNKRTGKAFMIAIPLASMIGGVMTPAGSPINLIGIGLLEAYNGTTISFVGWMLAGVPLALVILPLAWFLILKAYKPAPISHEKVLSFVEKMDIPAKATPKEIKTLIIAGTMFVLWILSSWFSFFNVMVISMVGCALLFFPGIEVLTVDTFYKENSWDAFFLVGTVLSLGLALSSNGVMSAFASLLPSMNLPLIVMLLIVCLITFLALVVLPVATSLISVMGTPLMALAAASAVNPALAILAVAICACNCYLLPLDTVTLITYGKGYYSMGDLLKISWILQIAVAILTSLWLPVVGLILGLV
jgi:sodium-dependent dicarboxylate transporter 2/3/5